MKETSSQKNIGILVAIEIDAILNSIPSVKELPSPPGFKLYQIDRNGYSLFVAQTGMGEINAAAGAQFLISACHVSMILNYGVVGGLTPEMKQQKIGLVNRVVHYKYDCSEFLDLKVAQVHGHDSIFLLPDEKLLKTARSLAPDLPLLTCCSGDKFIGTAEEKTYLHQTFQGDICDMEAAGIVLTCEANQIPCLLLKAVSDGLADGADGFFAELQRTSLKCFELLNQILDQLCLK